MNVNQSRTRAREIFSACDKSCPIITKQGIILRKLIAEGFDPVHAATAAGFSAGLHLPPWLADLSAEMDACRE